MKGKNFSCNNTGQRKKSDFYETPYSLTVLLLSTVSLMGTILEPAAGKGAIVKVLLKNKYDDVTYYDEEKDFLEERRHFSTIITNPPYSLAFEFIQHAKRVLDNFFPSSSIIFTREEKI